MRHSRRTRLRAGTPTQLRTYQHVPNRGFWDFGTEHSGTVLRRPKRRACALFFCGSV